MTNISVPSGERINVDHLEIALRLPMESSRLVSTVTLPRVSASSWVRLSARKMLLPGALAGTRGGPLKGRVATVGQVAHWRR